MPLKTQTLPIPPGWLPLGGRGERASWRVRLVRHLISRNPRSRPLNSPDPGLLPGVPLDPTASPTALLAAVANGEPGAFQRCVALHGPVVWAIVRRRVKDHHAAEDLVQEILTEIWKSAGRHDPKIASEAGFIAMIARRRAIDWIRRQERLPLLEPLAAGEFVAADSPSAGSVTDREALWSALAALPEETRRLFVLHFEKGMTHGEIAEATGMPLGSVKTRLRRGLIDAKAMLLQVGGGPNPGIHPKP